MYHGEPVIESVNALYEASQEGKPVQIHDIGASHHFAGSRDSKRLKDLRKATRNIVEPSGKITKATSIGSLFEWKGFRKCPTFLQTLFSWCQYFNKYPDNALVTTNKHVYEIRKRDIKDIQKNIIGTRVGNQWAVNTSFLKRSHEANVIEPTENCNMETACGAGLADGKPMGALSDVRLWHARFNHPGITYMKKVNKTYSLGLENKDIDAFYQGAKCPGCIAGKIQRSIKRTSTPKEFDEVWSVDLLGPYHPSLDDKRYTAVFVESKVGDIFIVHLQHKNDFVKYALPAWMKHRNQNLELYAYDRKEANPQSGIVLQGILHPDLKEDFPEEEIKYTKLRMDNARSFTSKAAMKYYDEKKLIFQTCGAGADDHAYRAEAAIKTITRMALSSLFGAKLDVVFTDANKKTRSLFTYALDMAVANKHYLPYSGNQNKSPFEAIRGRLPTTLEIKSLKTPFATAYCKTDTTNARQKKYKIGIMVGYAELGKYKIFFPHRLKLRATKGKHRTLVVRPEKHIVWDESMAHTVNRFDELAKYQDFQILYDQTPVVDKKLLDKSIPSDRETRSSKRRDTNKRVSFSSEIETPMENPQMAFKARQLDVQDKKLPALCAVVKKGTPQSDCPDCFSTPPKNWAECLKRPDRQLWIDALQAEEDGFDGEELPKKRIKRLSQSELADGAFIARGSVVLTIKWDSEGGLLVYNKHKVRIVGNNTMLGLPTFSPTVALTPQLMLLTIAAVLDIDVWFGDAKQAYLGTWLPDDHPPVYIRPPKCARRSFDEIWQSFVAIYGMEIAGRLFYLRVKNALVALGMIESTIFQATYRYSGKTCVARLSKFTLEDVQIFIATHVDDFIFVSTNDEFRLKLMKELSMTFTFGTDDQISTLLGLEITRNRKERTMEISCGAKIREMLKRYGLDQRTTRAETPHYMRQKLSSLQCPPADKKLDKLEYPYLSLLMTVAWISMHCRIELLFILSLLRQYQQNPGKEHFHALIRVCDYLRTYPDETIKIGACKNALEVVYDASFANLEDGHSTGAVLIRFFGTPIRVWVKKLSFSEVGKCSTSTTKAEVKTAAVACEQLDIVTNYIKEMGIDKLSDLPLKTQRYSGQAENRLPHLNCDVHEGLQYIPFYGDNRAVNGALTGTQRADALRSIKTWGKKPEGSHKAGIIFLRESCMNNDIMHCYITDVENSIDVLTKFKDGPTFHRHSRIIRGHAEIDFTKSIEVEEKLHKKATARKVFKRKLQYTPDKMNINLSNEDSDDAHVDIHSEHANSTFSSHSQDYASPYDYDYG